MRNTQHKVLPDKLQNGLPLAKYYLQLPKKVLNQYTVQKLKNFTHSMEITKIYSHVFFNKNFVRATFSKEVTKELISQNIF